MEESPTREKEKNQFYHISVAMECQTDDQLNEQYLDRNFSNAIQDSNVSIIVYAPNPYNPQHLAMRTFYPPNYFEPTNEVAKTWEVCCFANPYFFSCSRIGVAISEDLEKFFGYLKKLTIFFQNRKNLKFNQSLAFDSYGVFRNDDTWLKEEYFIEKLEAMIGQKLLDHKQKKELQHVNEGKLEEWHWNSIMEDQRQFLQKFAAQFKNMFGYLSYKKFQEYMQSL